jgi:hypothetical protein|tara:strand:- start:1699 stop:1968 length:270 start_codon:yes stop_codon:yes gene_type:complete
MPTYNSKEYLREAKRKAKRIGHNVEYSKKKDKKLDVFKGDKKVASIGARGMNDFIQTGDKEARKRYKARHERYRNKKNTPSYFADKILW